MFPLLKPVRALAHAHTLLAGAAVCTALWGTVACAPPVPPGTPDAGTAVDADAGPGRSDTLVWSDCMLPPGHARGAECTSAKLPLDWNAPDGTRIDVALMRYPATGTSKGQIWLLDGGPGGSGLAYATSDFLAYFPRAEWDIYIPVHRGTWRSTAIDCPGVRQTADDFTARCFEAVKSVWGAQVNQFNAINAGRDLGHFIAQTKAEDDRVVVFGSSYGTYWAQRYLQAHPAQADAVVLDGLLDLDADVEKNAIYANDVGFALMQECAEDTACAAHFTASDPVAAAERVRGMLGAPDHPCHGALQAALGGAGQSGEAEPELIKGLLGALLAEDMRILIPPVVHKLDRCDADDVTAVTGLVRAFFGGQGGEGRAGEDEGVNTPQFNTLMYLNVVYSELWRPRLSVDALEAQEAMALFGGAEAGGSFAQATDWAVIPLPVDTDHGPTTTPILMLQGALDPQTVPGWALKTQAGYDKPHQQLVMFDQALHGVLETAVTRAGTNCAADMMHAFIAAPTADLDVSCVDDVVRLDFAFEQPASRDIAEGMLGAANPW